MKIVGVYSFNGGVGGCLIVPTGPEQLIFML